VHRSQPTKDMQRGNALEPIAATMFAELSGFTVEEEPHVLVDKDRPWFRGNIDRWYTDKDGNRGVLEIKVPRSRTFQRFEERGLPQGYIVQEQHYMGLTGVDRGIFMILNPDSWDHLLINTEHDPEFYALIQEEDEQFWKAVQDGQEPQNDDPVPDLPIPASDIMTITSKDWCDALRAYEEADKLLEDAQGLKDDAKTAIKTLMPDYGIAELPGMAKVHWKLTQGRTSYDIEQLFHDYADIPREAYQKTGKPSEYFRVMFKD
jgi:hypothetical protein